MAEGYCEITFRLFLGIVRTRAEPWRTLTSELQDAALRLLEDARKRAGEGPPPLRSELRRETTLKPSLTYPLPLELPPRSWTKKR